MRVVVVAAALMCVLSGCVGGSEEGKEADVPADGMDEAVDLPNRAPTANVTADAPDNGTAPLNVTFHVQAFDADGDELAWTLILDNVTLANGTAVAAGNGSAAPTSGNATAGNTTTTGDATAGNATPGNATAGNGTVTTMRANVTHQFSEAGNYTVVLNVTDGTNSTVSNITITVVAEASEGPVLAGSEDSWVVFNPDGTCDAKGEVAVGPEYVHERGNPPGTGYLLGDGTWIYEESNGVDGLQVGGTGEMDLYAACLNPDTLIF